MPKTTTPKRSPAHDLDQAPFDEAAAIALAGLRANGAAYVSLVPGDATAYAFIVLAPDPAGAVGSPHRDHIVSLATSFGLTYPWNGGVVHEDYAASKWVAPTYRGRAQHEQWTGVVVARFLTTLARLLRPELVAEEA